MIQLGEKLGGKYFVTEAIDASRVGHFVEVRDAQGTIYHAQPLLSRALPKEDLDQLKAEVDAVPRSMAFFKPDAVVWSKSGVPVAVYPALPPTPLLSRLAALFTGGLEERRRSALRALLGMFAPMAEELNNLHAVGVVHGAITIARLHVVEDRGVERLSLSGFGIEAAERYAGKKPRPQPKADFAALTLCLADAMDRVKARPEGAPLVRWEMLRNCARAGDHPALQSGVALATAMRGVLDEPWRRTPLKGTPAVGEPIRASISSPGVPAVSAPPGAPAVSAPAPAPTPTTTGGFVAPPEEPAAPPRRRAALLGGLAVTLLLGGAATVYMLRDGRSSGGALPGPIALRSMPRCEGEDPAAPPSVELPGPAAGIDAVCLGGATPAVVALTLSGETLSAVQREARRGSRWGAPATVAEHVAEVGTSIPGEGREPSYAAWRNLGSPAFTVATVDRAVTPARIETPGWRGEDFHGVVLLRADAGSAWIASTYVTEGRSSVVALRLSREPEPGEATMTVFRLLDGSLLSAIPGDPATLLVAEASGGGRELTVVSLPVASLPGLSPRAAVADGGVGDPTRVVPATTLQRSPRLALEATALSAAPLGLGASGTSRRFLVTAGEATPCAGEPCNVEGEARLLSFPPQGEATSQTFSAQAQARGLFSGADGELLSWVERRAVPRGAVWTLRPDGAIYTGAWVQGSLAHADVVLCGDERWQVAVSSAAPGRVSALPLACSRARVNLPAQR